MSDSDQNMTGITKNSNEDFAAALIKSVQQILKGTPRNKAGRPENKGPKMPEMHTSVIHAFNRSDKTALPYPDKQFAVYLPPVGSKQIVQVLQDRRICVKASLDSLVYEISTYAANFARDANRPEYQWLHKDDVSCAKSWLSRTTPVPIPKPYVFLSEHAEVNDPQLAFERLHFDLKPCPSLDNSPVSREIFHRVSDPRLLLSFIGSIFRTGSYRQGYLCLIGEGRDGKGSLAAMIQRVLGAAAVGLQDMPEDKHWAISFEGKRLAIFNDLENVHLINDAKFKALTGGDSLFARPLYAPPYQIVPECLTWINTNKRNLPLSSERHSLERPMILTISPPKVSGHELNEAYRHDLWKEIETLIGHAVYVYDEDNVHGRKLRSNEATHDIITAMVSESEDEFETAMESRFVAGNYYMQPKDFQRLLLHAYPSPKHRAAFTAFLKRKFGVKKEKMRMSDNRRHWMWIGIGDAENPKAVAAPPDGCLSPFVCAGALICQTKNRACCVRKDGPSLVYDRDSSFDQNT